MTWYFCMRESKLIFLFVFVILYSYWHTKTSWQFFIAMIFGGFIILIYYFIFFFAMSVQQNANRFLIYSSLTLICMYTKKWILGDRIKNIFYKGRRRKSSYAIELERSIIFWIRHKWWLDFTFFFFFLLTLSFVLVVRSFL